MRNWNQQLPGQCPEEMLAGKQAEFSLTVQGTGRVVAELESATARTVPRGNAGWEAGRIFSDGSRYREGGCGTGIGELWQQQL